MQFYECSQQEYNLLKHILNSQETIDAFQHWSIVPTYILALIEKFPKLLHCRLLEEAREHNRKKRKTLNLFKIINEYHDVHNSINDIERMAIILGIEDIKQRYQNVRTRKLIKKLHDTLVDKINSDPILATEYQIRFPDPPLQGNEAIQYIKNAYELKSEGQDMAHCVSSYIDSALTGSVYYYKVFKPQRGTL